jgi:hypothetical protein
VAGSSHSPGLSLNDRYWGKEAAKISSDKPERAAMTKRLLLFVFLLVGASLTGLK